MVLWNGCTTEGPMAGGPMAGVAIGNSGESGIAALKEPW